MLLFFELFFVITPLKRVFFTGLRANRSAISQLRNNLASKISRRQKIVGSERSGLYWCRSLVETGKWMTLKWRSWTMIRSM